MSGGQGEPLVIVHGGGDGARAWERNAQALAGFYSVFIPDLPGFGKSQSMGEKFHMHKYASFIEDFSGSLGLNRFNLMGHSIGGNISLNYALKYPEKVKRLVLVSSWGLGKEVAPWIRFLSQPFFCDTLGELLFAAARGIKWFHKTLFNSVIPLNFFNRVQIDIGRSMVNLEGQKDVLMHRLSELLMPTLLIWGGRDPVVPAYQSYSAAKLIPDCRVHVFQDCGHSVYRQRLPDFNQLLHNFLNKQG